MISKVYPVGELKKYKYVVVLSQYQGKILLSRHKERETWETQGGHVEEWEKTYMKRYIGKKLATKNRLCYV